MPVSALLTCRLVARSWNAEAVYWIRRKQARGIYLTEDNWSRFCNDFENCELYPFAKLGLQLCCACIEDFVESIFFTQHCPFIKDLCIWAVEEGEWISRLANLSSIHVLSDVCSTWNKARYLLTPTLTPKLRMKFWMIFPSSLEWST